MEVVRYKEKYLVSDKGAGVGFTLIAITWIGMLATLLIAWIGGNI